MRLIILVCCWEERDHQFESSLPENSHREGTHPSCLLFLNPITISIFGYQDISIFRYLENSQGEGTHPSPACCSSQFQYLDIGIFRYFNIWISECFNISIFGYLDIRLFQYLDILKFPQRGHSPFPCLLFLTISIFGYRDIKICIRIFQYFNIQKIPREIVLTPPRLLFLNLTTTPQFQYLDIWRSEHFHYYLSIFNVFKFNNPHCKQTHKPQSYTCSKDHICQPRPGV